MLDGCSQTTFIWYVCITLTFIREHQHNAHSETKFCTQKWTYNMYIPLNLSNIHISIWAFKLRQVFSMETPWRSAAAIKFIYETQVHRQQLQQQQQQVVNTLGCFKRERESNSTSTFYISHRNNLIDHRYESLLSRLVIFSTRIANTCKSQIYLDVYI